VREAPRRGRGRLAADEVRLRRRHGAADGRVRRLGRALSAVAGGTLASANRALRRLGEAAGQFSAVGFGLAYMAAIPLFAFVYHWFLPFDFFHGTARFEPLVLNETQSLAKNLKDAFWEAAGREGKDRPTINGHRLSVPAPLLGTFPMFSIEAEPDHVRIVVRLVVFDPPRRGNPLVRFALELVDGGMLTPQGSDLQVTSLFFAEVRPTSTSVGAEDISLPQLFPCRSDAERARTCLLMTLPDRFRLDTLRSTASGRPSPSYVRMLYFSAVTISTLGYGDIVPLTNRARGVVTIQVVLGPLLFGLFLNSLIKERNRPAPRDPSSD
jgi:hypothetical protein